MGFVLQDIHLQNWRNFSSYELRLAPKLTILHGHNAVGKTNIIEACEVITRAASFRKPKNTQLIGKDAETAHILAHITDNARTITLRGIITSHKKIFQKNTKNIPPKELSFLLPSVIFTPDDLLFIKQSAQFRREEFDTFGASIHAGYQAISKTYQQLLLQRNALLKQPYLDENTLLAWDESFAKGATALLFARAHLVHRIKGHISQIYHDVSQHEELDIFYHSSLFDETDDITTLKRQEEQLMQATKDELFDLYMQKLTSIHSREITRQQSLIGPQRDDVLFYVDNKPARNFASQGQQRSCVLAQKIAEILVVKDITGQYPLLLLDDVMSELDETRREMTLRFIEERAQTILTTTNLSYFSSHILDEAKVVTVHDNV